MMATMTLAAAATTDHHAGSHRTKTRKEAIEVEGGPAKDDGLALQTRPADTDMGAGENENETETATETAITNVTATGAATEKSVVDAQTETETVTDADMAISQKRRGRAPSSAAARCHPKRTRLLLRAQAREASPKSQRRSLIMETLVSWRQRQTRSRRRMAPASR